jgi:hypothetical protein
MSGSAKYEPQEWQRLRVEEVGCSRALKSAWKRDWQNLKKKSQNTTGGTND